MADRSSTRHCSWAPKSGRVGAMTFMGSSWDAQTTCCCVWGMCGNGGHRQKKGDKGLGLWSGKQTKTSTSHCAHHKSSAPNELVTLWTEGRQCWKPWAGAGGRDQLLNNCSLHLIFNKVC